MKIVIKFAGALLEDELVMRGLARQVAALAREGHELLVVHGGGRYFTSTLERMGLESRFVSGLRVTDRFSAAGRAEFPQTSDHACSVPSHDRGCLPQHALERGQGRARKRLSSRR